MLCVSFAIDLFLFVAFSLAKLPQKRRLFVFSWLAAPLADLELVGRARSAR
jgi:hypothetical protein